MAWKDLLVHIDDGKASPGRVAAAIALARAHAALLTGLYVVAEPELPGFLLSEMPAAWHEQTRRRRERRGPRRARRSGGAGRAGRGLPDRPRPRRRNFRRRRRARASRPGDRRQADPDEPERPAGRRPRRSCRLQPARDRRALYRGGRDRRARRRRLGRRPKHPRRQRRVAAADKAKSVIARRRPRPTAAGHGAEPGADIALHLARHGVKVAVQHIEASDIAVADAILSRLADTGADLLVMGAYGHSRARELLLGGVTRQVLPQMTVPVLMSH
jgi:nucleotide-binding universal stress UspA family protein